MAELFNEPEVATRVFKFNDHELSDPDPTMSADQVMDFYTLTYPEVATAQLVGPTVEENGHVSYEFKTKIGTKG